MPRNSLSYIAPTTMGDDFDNPDDDFVSSQGGLASIWSYVSEQLAREHRALQEQHQLLTSRWDSVRDLLICNERQLETYSRRLEAKDAEIRRLVRALIGQSTRFQDDQLSSRPSSIEDGSVISAGFLEDLADVGLEECQEVTVRITCDELQAEPTAQNVQAQQRSGEDPGKLLRDLEKTNGDLRNQLTSLTSNLGSVTAELKTVQNKCASAECCTQIIGDLKSRSNRAEEIIKELHGRLENLQKKSQETEKTIGRLKRQRRDRESTHKQQLNLRKNEYCELERSLDEVKDERDSLRCQLSEAADDSAASLVAIKILESKCSVLESEKCELETSLGTSRSQCTSLQKRQSALSSSVSATEHELTVVTETLRKIRLQASALPRLRQHREHLQWLEATPGKLCNPTHLDFSCLTDCGTLLCVKCAPDAPDVEMDAAFGLGTMQHFEIDRCPWCPADTWSWQHLDVPYSLTLVQEMTALWDAIAEPSI